MFLSLLVLLVVMVEGSRLSSCSSENTERMPQP